MRRVSEIGDVVYRNTIGKIDEQLKKLDPGTILKNLSKGDGVLAKGSKRLLGILESPLLRKMFGAAPFIGDAIVFLIDLLSGKHWVRALLRTLGAFGVDWGFYTLMGMTALGAPFSGGTSLALSAAILAAYMAADAAAGAALGNDGIGQFLGDFVADKLGVPKKAGEAGGGAWESLFGGGGKINSSQGSVEKLIEGVKLSDKEKEAISRVGGGLGDPNMRVLEGEDKERAIKKLEFHKERNQLRRSYGRNSDEVKALEKEYMESMSNTYPSSITGNTNTTKYEGLDKQASYEEEGTTTYVVSQKGSSGGEETSSGTNAEVTKMSEGLILSGSGGDTNNSYDVLAKR